MRILLTKSIKTRKGHCGVIISTSYSKPPLEKRWGNVTYEDPQSEIPASRNIGEDNIQ
jgi:hypothetical protein